MMLWDIIRDWFVVNVWGGSTSVGTVYNPTVGVISEYLNGEFDDAYNGGVQDLLFKVTNHGNFDSYLSLGDWLSTTSTIIVLIAVCVALYFLVRYFFRMFAGLLSGR